MRKIIVVLAIVGALSVSAIAGAATSYWNERGATYACEGVDAGVQCWETDGGGARYEVIITRGFVTIAIRNSPRIVYSCQRKRGVSGCFRG